MYKWYRMFEQLPDEFYIWEEFRSTRNFDIELWSHFRVAVKFGRVRWSRSVLCKRCKKLVGWSGCTGNLRNHIKYNHSEEIERKRDIEIKPRILEIAGLTVDEYKSVLVKLIKDTFTGATRTFSVLNDYQYCHEIPLKGGKYPIWNFFMISETDEKNVRCCLCQRDIYWNRKGLEKLKRHVDRIHVDIVERKRVDELYRFIVRLGIQKFIGVVGS